MAKRNKHGEEEARGKKKKVPPVAQMSEDLGPAAAAAGDIRREELPPLDTADTPGPGESLPVDEGLPHGVGQAAEKLPDTEKLSGDVGKLIQGTPGGMATPERQIGRARSAARKTKKAGGEESKPQAGQPSKHSEQ